MHTGMETEEISDALYFYTKKGEGKCIRQVKNVMII